MQKTKEMARVAPNEDVINLVRKKTSKL